MVGDLVSSPFRLLHVIPDLDPRSGGTVSALAGLAIAQHRQLGWDVAVVTCATAHSDARIVNQLRSSGVAVAVLPPGRRFIPQQEFKGRVSSLIAKTDCVHVHAVWEELQYVACTEAVAQRVPYVISPHGMLDPWSLSQGRLKKWLYLRLRMKKHLDHAFVIHCTTQLEKSLIEPLLIRAKKHVIPNGIDLAEFECDEKSGNRSDCQEWFYQRCPQARGKRIVLLLSRLHPKKGLDLLLPAFSQLREKNALLVLAGPGDEQYVDKLNDECRKHEIIDRVFFTGMLQGAERISVLRAADVFVLPSYQENFGIAVVESLAAGTPVVISDQVNFAEFLKGADFASIVKQDISEVCDAIEKVLAYSEEDRSVLGDEAIRFSKKFHFDRIAQEWCCLMDSSTLQSK